MENRDNIELNQFNSYMFEAAPYAVLVTNFDGNIIYMNKYVLELLNENSEKKFFGKHVSKIFSDQFADDIAKKLSALTSNNKIIRKEYILKAKNDKEITVLVNIKLLKNKRNAKDGFIISLCDISNRKELESQLLHKTMKCDAFIDNPNVGIFIMNKDGIIEFTNHCFTGMLGYKPGELSSIKFVSLVIPENRYNCLKVLKDRDFIKRQIFEYCLINKNGDKINILIAFMLLHSDTPNKIIATVMDITDKKILQEQLLHSEKLSAVGQLAKGLAHEFNNILAIIQGNVQLAKSESDDISLNEYIDVIAKQVDRGAQIINNIKNFLKIPSPVMKECNIIEIMDKVINLLRGQFAFENIRIETNYKISSSLLVDPIQFQQVFLNLFLNARDAIRPLGMGTIKVRIKENTKTVNIQISDSGTGISDDIKDDIFNVFFSTKRSYTQDQAHGFGLGLSVVYKIINLHGGNIRLISSKPACFEVSLNKVNIVKKDVSMNSTSVIENSAKQHLNKIRHLKILIVDDEENITEILSKSLQKVGCNNVYTAENGKIALKMLKDDYFDIVFLDLVLKDMSGDAVFDEIKRRNIKTNVVFISGKIEVDEESLLQKGSIAFLKKPFYMKDIFNILKNLSIDKTIMLEAHDNDIINLPF